MTILTTTTPKVGDGATIQYWSDRHAATVIWVSSSGHQVKVQEDDAKRIDNNGMSETQQYSYTPNPNGVIHLCTRRADGSYRVKGTSARVVFGYRNKYHDYSF